MFDSFFKSKFHSKCKSALKISKTRIDTIKRKRNAMEKFLKKDIIDLLKNDLDFNAYGRAEGLLVELNMSKCYNFVGEFCVCLLKQVPKMDKQRDCPEECKEAVSTLLYAAARFADLPELRELRELFISKYGQPFEANINQEFVKRLKATPPTKEMKIQLLQNIASESGKTWDSKALEQKLYVPPPSEDGLLEDTNNDKITKKNTEKSRRHSSIPSSPRRLKDPPSFRTRRALDNLQGNESLKADQNKPFQSKFSPPPPYHRRSSSEDKYENGNNTIHEAKNDEIKNYQKKFAPVSSRRRGYSWDQEEKKAGLEEKSEKISGDDIKNNPNREKLDEKQRVQSKFAPPVPYSWQRPEISPAQEKNQQQDESVEKPKPKPKSVRSVRSKRSMIPPDEGKVLNNEDSLEAIRQELATKPRE